MAVIDRDPAKESLDRMGRHIDEMDEYLRSTTPQEQGSGGSDANFDRPAQSAPPPGPTSHADKAKKAAKAYQKARNDPLVGPLVQRGEHFLRERVEKGIGKGLAHLVTKVAKIKSTDQPIEPTSAVRKAVNALPSVLAVPFALEGAAVGYRAGGPQGAGTGLVTGFKTGRDIVGKPIKSVAENITKSYYDELNKPYREAQAKKKKTPPIGTPIHGGTIQRQPSATTPSIKVPASATTPSVKVPASASTPSVNVPASAATPSFQTPRPTHVSSAGTTQSKLEIGPPVVRDTMSKRLQGSDYYTPQFIGASGAVPYYNYGFARKSRKPSMRRKRPAKGARKSKKRVSS